MRAVYKYTIPLDDVVSVELPTGSKILCVQSQRDDPQIWALVDPTFPVEKETRTFRIVGTGHQIDDLECENYIGTFQIRGGSLVFHVFEIGHPVMVGR